MKLPALDEHGILRPPPDTRTPEQIQAHIDELRHKLENHPNEKLDKYRRLHLAYHIDLLKKAES